MGPRDSQASPPPGTDGKVRLESVALEAAISGIVIADRTGTMTWANAAFTRMTGYTLPEVVGQHTRLLKSGRHDGALYRDLWDTVLSGRVWHGRLINRRKDGSLYTEEQLIAPLRDERGEISHFIAIKQDVSEQTRAQDLFRRSEEQFRAIIENALDIIAILDRDGTIRYVSPSVESVLGYSPGDLIGTCVLEVVHPDERAHVQSVFVSGLHTPGFPAMIECRVRHKDGSWRVLEGVGKTLLHEAEGRAAVVTSRDITERKRLEEQFLQAQKMEAVGRLAGGVAHDFNNLLTIITGRSQLLLHRLPAGDPGRRELELIEKTAGRAAALTRQLLAFSRKQVLEPKALDLNAVVGGVAGMLRRLIGEDVELVLVPGPALGRVYADPAQLEQVILNLAVNARDAMPGGGRLAIETANADLDEAFLRGHPGARSGPHVMLAVTDTGIGMSAEIQARIFEPFFTTKDTGKGTGLGLSTVYGIVKQHEGYIGVDSEPGRGTAFRIYLPRPDATAEAVETAAAAPALRQGSETILLVEDEAEVRTLAREVLELGGYTVLEAAGAAEALEACARHQGPIPLVITDVVLPQMDGRALAEQLERARPGMRVLYVSGYTDEILSDHGVLKPGTNLLPKPFTPEALARKVREVLDAPRPAPA